MDPEEIPDWAASFAGISARFDDLFGSRESRIQARKYLRGLLAGLERSGGVHLGPRAEAGEVEESDTGGEVEKREHMCWAEAGRGGKDDVRRVEVAQAGRCSLEGSGAFGCPLVGD